MVEPAVNSKGRRGAEIISSMQAALEIENRRVRDREQLMRTLEGAVAQYRRRKDSGESVVIVRDGEQLTFTIFAVHDADDGGKVILVSQSDGRYSGIAADVLAQMEAASKSLLAVSSEPTVVAVSKSVPKKRRRAVADPAPGVASDAIPVDAASAPDPKAKVPVKLTFGALDVSDAVDDRAYDAADSKMHREKQELTGISGFFAKVFKHNIAREVFRQWEAGRLRAKILQERNLLAAEGGSLADHERAVGAVFDRFFEEGEEFLHGEEGQDDRERRVRFAGEVTSPEEKKVKDQIEALVRSYAANPAMDREELRAERDAIFVSARKLAGEARGRGELYADNIEKLAEEVRRQAAHAGGLENIELDLEIVIGKAKMGARTEREKSTVDAVLDKLRVYGSGRHIGAGVVGLFQNEIAVAVGAISALTFAGTRAGLSTVASSALTFGGSGIAAGAFAWWQEKKRLKGERGLHERQTALGETLIAERDPADVARETADLKRQLADPKIAPWYRPDIRAKLSQRIASLEKPMQPRRAEMKQFEQYREPATVMTNWLRYAFDSSTQQLNPSVDVLVALNNLAATDALIRVSNRERTDLVQYSGIVEAEEERRDLDKARMELKRALRSAIPDFDAEYKRVYQAREAEVYENMQAVEKRFAEWQGEQARKRAYQSMVIGGAFGVVAHDMWNLAFDGETTTGGLYDWAKQYFGDGTPTGAASAHREVISGGHFSMPENTDLEPQTDGSFSLMNTSENTVIAEGLHIDEYGTFDASSKAALDDAGVHVVESHQTVTGTEVIERTEKTWDWLRSHPYDVIHVHRDMWMGNNTPMHLSEALQKWLGADGNELGLRFGEKMQVGINANGDFVMDMSAMTSGGSVQDGMIVDAPEEVVNGNVRLLLSASTGTQNHPIQIFIDQYGKATIPADSDIAKTFFREVNGRAVFIGKFAEIVVATGADEGYVEHVVVLATHVGKGITEGITSEAVGESVEATVTDIEMTRGIVLPWVTPIRRRSPLEPTAQSAARRRQNLKPDAPSDTNPDADAFAA